MRAIKITMSLLACIALLIAAGPARKGYSPGDVAIDFKLKNVDNKMVALGDFSAAKGFIVIFDCNSCPYSKAYNSRIIALNKKYAALGFPVVAINSNDPSVSPDDSFDEMVKEAHKKNYTFPYLYDESQEIAKTYGATNTPHVFVLMRSGHDLIVSYIGAIDDNARDASAVKKKYVEEAVGAILDGKSVQTRQTRALGCGIKWKDS